MPTDMMFWVLFGISAFLTGASKGGLPMVGLLSVPVMAVKVSPVVAAGLLLPIYIVSDMYGLWMYSKSFDSRNIKIIVSSSLIGLGIGWATASVTDGNLVKLMVGIIGLSYCLDALLKVRRVVPAKPADLPRGIFWGILTGFTSFVSHSGGTPYQMYVLPQKLDKMVYAGTATITFAIINLLKLPPYWMLNQISVGSLKVCAIIAPVSILGAWCGYHLTRIIPHRIFFRLVEIALFLLSIKLIYDFWTAH